MDELKKACNDISEEELAKLSVALLNCQSDSEGRPTYSCTVDMVSLGLGFVFDVHSFTIDNTVILSMVEGTPL